MMTERDPVGADLLGKAVQGAAAQAGAQAAGSLALGDNGTHDAVGILLDDVILEALGVEVITDHALGIARLLLVEVYGDQVEGHRGTALQRAQDIQHGVGVLAAGQADHDPVTLADHGEIDDCLAHLPAQAFLQFVELGPGTPWIALHGRSDPLCR